MMEIKFSTFTLQNEAFFFKNEALHKNGPKIRDQRSILPYSQIEICVPRKKIKKVSKGPF
jgi:hypothetical protein